jgi:tight adherence protein B
VPQLDPALLSSPVVLAGLVAGVIVVMSMIVAAVVAVRVGPRARLRDRMAGVAGTGRQSTAAREIAARQSKLIQGKAKDLATSGRQAQRRIALRLMIEQAGMTTSPQSFYVWSLISALLGTAFYLLLGYPPAGAVPTAIFMGLGFPRWMIKRKATKRQRQFTSLFADAIDVIVRGIRSGLPVGECLNIIARESPEPVGAEFRLLIESQRLGMTIKDGLDRSVRRMPTADMKFFAIVLTLQQQTGGNLAETLSNLSGVLRARKKMQDKVRSMSAEARMTASIIGSLPFILSFIIYLMNPEYISLLWTDPTGVMITYFGLGWMSIGVFVMKQMISFEI